MPTMTALGKREWQKQLKMLAIGFENRTSLYVDRWSTTDADGNPFNPIWIEFLVAPAVHMSNAILQEQYLESVIPSSHRALFLPGNLVQDIPHQTLSVLELANMHTELEMVRKLGNIQNDTTPNGAKTRG